MTHTKRNFTVATIIAAALAGLPATNASAKDASPTLNERMSAHGASVFTATAETSNDQTPSKSRYGKR
ncbi:MAG: hypothetical protein CMI62_13120 [Parvibaculum sp.]|jgi:hypothetical protein|uniref:hypothetical protein n=1 Tax=Parvibaculum sp. TaxID=2024848 RepID=UPI000C5F469A|nr:hypothetical protein [Parvibaculum sp.]MAU61657.1 hypothetical protein [Parvibaculum sp.]HAC59644.1 hypothetical protein [Rhodobiaceae bacterium]|tara:strand:- start:17047 stop:17250 length:204 start_codon:yes stop_codon:yes gene_type:complete